MCNFGHNAPKRYCYKYNIQDITTECQVILRYDAPFCTSRFAVTLAKHRILVIFRATHSMSLRHHILVVIRATHYMSLRGATRRGNLPEGNPFHKTHARYFCTCVEKKAHTSKRVSIIAYNNVISKAQCAPRRHKLPYGTFAAQRH